MRVHVGAERILPRRPSGRRLQHRVCLWAAALTRARRGLVRRARTPTACRTPGRYVRACGCTTTRCSTRATPTMRDASATTPSHQRPRAVVRKPPAAPPPRRCTRWRRRRSARAWRRPAPQPRPRAARRQLQWAAPFRACSCRRCGLRCRRRSRQQPPQWLRRQQRSRRPGGAASRRRLSRPVRVSSCRGGKVCCREGRARPLADPAEQRSRG